VKRGKPGPRRAGIEPTIGLIVEGDAEYEALPLLHRRGLLPGCPPIKPTNLHGVGSDREPIGVAKLIIPKVIQHQIAGRNRVIVCIDREQRQRCAPGFASDVAAALATELKKLGRTATGVQVVIADRAFEAWLLADSIGLYKRGVFKVAPTFNNFEGKLGIEQKKGVLELERLLGRPYSKTVDGPALFAKLNLTDARNHRGGMNGSKSLDKLLRSLVPAPPSAVASGARTSSPGSARKR
jgi:hypothetical protein